MTVREALNKAPPGCTEGIQGLAGETSLDALNWIMFCFHAATPWESVDGNYERLKDRLCKVITDKGTVTGIRDIHLTNTIKALALQVAWALKKPVDRDLLNHFYAMLFALKVTTLAQLRLWSAEESAGIFKATG